MSCVIMRRMYAWRGRRCGIRSSISGHFLRQPRLCLNTHETQIVKHQIEAETSLSREHLTPELSLHLITPSCHLWSSLPHLSPFPDPFWGFYWPGGQAVTSVFAGHRYILDNPLLVRGKTVLDFGCGCGASGLAAKSAAGAKHVTFNDIDKVALEAIQMNAKHKQHPSGPITCSDLVGSSGHPYEVVIDGDLLYDTHFAGQVLSWIQNAHKSPTQT